MNFFEKLWITKVIKRDHVDVFFLQFFHFKIRVNVLSTKDDFLNHLFIQSGAKQFRLAGRPGEADVRKVIFQLFKFFTAQSVDLGEGHVIF